MKKGEYLTLTVGNFAAEGKAIARHDGLVVFIEDAVPGDTVVAKVTKVKKQFLEARAEQVLSISPLRVEPRCRHFGTCGGCKWQHVSYSTQCEFKRQQVRDVLERIGGFTDLEVKPTLASSRPYFYRNKMEFSFGERWLMREELQDLDGEAVDRFALGLHIPRRFDRVLDIDECFLQSEVSAQIVNAVRTFCRDRNLSIFSTITQSGYLRNLVIRQSVHTDGLMVNLVTSDDEPTLLQEFSEELLRQFPMVTTVVNNITRRRSQVATGEVEKVYHGPGFITERIGKRTYRISANSFFQTNTLQAERLYDTVRTMAALQPDDVVFDLYSGTGTIAFHLADDVSSVVGIEGVSSAVADARENARSHSVANCTFVSADLATGMSESTLVEAYGTPSAIIIDPPRAGMHENVVRSVLRMLPDRIVYVSCNPATQARDLKIMCETGSYSINGVQPVDMFPHTHHIENVVALRLQAS